MFESNIDSGGDPFANIGCPFLSSLPFLPSFLSPFFSSLWGLLLNPVRGSGECCELSSAFWRSPTAKRFELKNENHAALWKLLVIWLNLWYSLHCHYVRFHDNNNYGTPFGQILGVGTRGTKTPGLPPMNIDYNVTDRKVSVTVADTVCQQ